MKRSIIALMVGITVLYAAAPAEAKRVLIITTSNSELYGTGKKTGLWLEEFTAPYYALKDAGHEMTVASLLGGNVPIDPKSLGGNEPSVMRFNKDPATADMLHHSVPLKKVDGANYDAVYFPGGHGTMWDVADNNELKNLLEPMLARHVVVAAICHGPVGLLNLTKPNGTPYLKGRKVTGFSNEEEKDAGFFDIVPHPLQSRLEDIKAMYSHGPKFTPYVVQDRELITGQNPASSASLGTLMVKALAK